MLNDRLPNKNHYEAGIVKSASAAWKVFRCRADEDNSHRHQRFLLACSMIVSGEYSIREICKETDYAKNTIMILVRKILAVRQKNGMPDILCPCGKPIQTHKGWCSFRYNKSEARQSFIRNWRPDNLLKPLISKQQIRSTPLKLNGI